MLFASVRDLLAAEHGPQGWWPAETPFEIMVGALLVQRTNWSNAEKAIAALERIALLEPAELAVADPAVVEHCVRPAGFFRTKAARLRHMAAFVIEAGGIDGLSALPSDRLRRLLLRLPGVGAETADAILLYVFGRPAVVVDAYLRRLTMRLKGADRRIADDTIVAAVFGEISAVDELQEFHALVVAHGKTHCRTVPRCDTCSVSSLCRAGQR